MAPPANLTKAAFEALYDATAQRLLILNCSEDAARAQVSRGLRGLQQVIERPQGA